MNEREPRGLYFEDFEIGKTYLTPRRTVTSTDIVSFACLSGDFNEVHANIEYASVIVLDGDSSLNPETGEVTEGAPPPEEVHEALSDLGINHVGSLDAVVIGLRDDLRDGNNLGYVLARLASLRK